jgi:tRNA threonylcarbamoyladenosine biosynthesis protein TsaE
MKLIFSKTILNAQELESLVKEVSDLVTIPALILLTGDLGAGKTSFVSAFCMLHNISDVQSPTYSIHNCYVSKTGIVVDHLDLYRLESADELESAGLFDILTKHAAYKFVEWPERANNAYESYKGSIFKIKISIVDEQKRIFDFYKIS